MNAPEIATIIQSQASQSQAFNSEYAPTSLIRLNQLSDLTSCEILGKAEFLNPSGSVKYRAARAMIEEAESTGQLQRGDTIIEGSAGNTGLGLTIVGRAKGYQTVVVINDSESPEKIAKLREFGARVVTVPEQPPEHPENYVQVAQRLAGEHGWFWSNQFDNLANRNAHYQTTGPEIWRQTNGQVTAFVSVVGSGGTLAGTSIYLKERNSKIAIVCADPFGASMWSWFTHGRLEPSDGHSCVEGIGQMRVTRNLEGIAVDRAYRIPDQAAFTVIEHLKRDEDLDVGLSSGVNLAGALRWARESGPGQVIVTALCDSGASYRSRLFNREWLDAHGLRLKLPIESVLAG